jgi:hypothetical protein
MQVTREEAIKRMEWLRMVGNHVDSVTLGKEDMPYFDMAIAALKDYDALLAEIKDMCFLCRHYNNGKGNELCECCDDEDNFEWRGAQREDT